MSKVTDSEKDGMIPDDWQKILDQEPFPKGGKMYKRRKKQMEEQFARRQEIEARLENIYDEICGSIEAINIEEMDRILSNFHLPENHPASDETIEDLVSKISTEDLLEGFTSRSLSSFYLDWPPEEGVDDFALNIDSLGRVAGYMVKIALKRGQKEIAESLTMHGFFYQGFSMAFGGLCTSEDRRRSIAKKGGRAKAKKLAEVNFDKLNLAIPIKYIALYLLEQQGPRKKWETTYDAQKEIQPKLIKRMSEEGYIMNDELKSKIQVILTDLVSNDVELIERIKIKPAGR